MGRRVALIALVTTTVVGVLGCGGSRHTQATSVAVSPGGVVTCTGGCGVSFHSSSHHYTVREVEAVFAAQDIRFRKVKPRMTIGPFVLLRYGHTEPQLISAVVKTSAKRAGGLEYLAEPADSHYHLQRHGNVIVVFDPSNMRAVSAALARLH